MFGHYCNIIEKIWPESYIVLGDNASGLGTVAHSFSDTLINLGIVIAIIAIFLFAFARIVDGLVAAVISLFNYKELIKIEGQANLFTSRNILLIFALIVFAFLFANTEIACRVAGEDFSVGIIFLSTLLCFMLYFTLRSIAFHLLNWVNRASFFKYLSRIYYTHMALGLVFSVLGFIIYMLFPNLGISFLKIYLVPILSVIMIMYFVRGNQIIISNGFSHSFWILYLCTLEILPLVVLGHVMFS